MKIKDFKPVPQEDHPKLPKELWEVLAPIQTQIKDLTQLAQKRIGLDNLNFEILEGKMTPGTEAIFSLVSLNGALRGAMPILVDSGSSVDMFRLRVIDEKKVGLTVTLDPAVSTEVTVRCLVIGA